MENPFNRKIEWKQDGRTFGWGASPDADWKVIFLATLLLIVMVTAWDAFTYLKIKSGDLSQGGEAVAELPALDRASLEKTVEYYAGKAEELEKIKSGSAYGVVDPSL